MLVPWRWALNRMDAYLLIQHFGRRPRGNREVGPRCNPSSLDLYSLRRQGVSKLAFQVEGLNQRKEEVTDDTYEMAGTFVIGWNPMSLVKKRWHHSKTHHAGVTTAILLLAVLAGLSGCQSEQSSPAATDAIPSKPGLSLGIASVPNLRDLGGYETRDGATVVRGLVYRSNQLAPISPSDMEKLVQLGLKK